MPDARALRPLRAFLLAAVLLTAARVDAQGSDSTGKARAAAAQAAAQRRPEQQAVQAAAALLARQQAAGTPQPPLRRWSAPKPCAGTPVFSHGRPGAGTGVPNFVGAPLSAARGMLGQNLVLAVRFAPGTGQRDSILSQAPAADSLVAPGDTIIVCSYALVRMPNVMGASETAAQRALRDSGFNSVVTTLPLETTEGAGTVRRQNPEANSAAPPGSTDTLFIGVAPALPVYRMPNVSGTYLAAQDSLALLRARTKYALPVSPKFLDSAPPPGLLVEGQQPPPDAVINPKTTVLLTLRDTTTPAPTQATVVALTPPEPAPKQFAMPRVIGAPLAAALDSIAALRRISGFRLAVSARGTKGTPPRDSVVVDIQSPAAGTLLSSDTAVQLVLRLIPRPSVVIMPNVVGRTVRSARDTLSVLGISFSATAVDRDDNAGDAWIIARQTPAAGDTITAATPVHLYANAPFPWIWVIAGVGAATAAAAATAYHHVGKTRVARMAVAARPDLIAPRMTLQVRAGETADEAFNRIGISFTPVAQRGTATLTRVRLPLPYNRDHDG